MSQPLRIGNAQAFWGDSPDAPARLLMQQPHLDFLTLDYLAEVSLSILAIQRERDPSLGYARDFIEVVRTLLPFWQNGSKIRVVTNAGGLNPEGCARTCLDILRSARCDPLKVAVVAGDDVAAHLKGDARNPLFKHLESGKSLTTVADQLVTANAYLGAPAIAHALNAGASIVITGRVADPSLTVGPCMHHFGWKLENHDALAGATVAGHLIECGTQVTGGFSTDWLATPDPGNIGFPIAEVRADGSCVITKPPGTGGEVNERTVKEQLLYEIGDPGNYLSPDVTLSLLGIDLKTLGKDRVQVRGAKGRAATRTYKVSATYRDGFKAHAMLTIYGRDAVAKARRCGTAVFEKLKRIGVVFERSEIECLGTGACAPGVVSQGDEKFMETVLRLSVADSRHEAVERFTKEIAPLITSGPQGITGYTGGRPKVQSVFGYWPCLIEKKKTPPRFRILS